MNFRHVNYNKEKQIINSKRVESQKKTLQVCIGFCFFNNNLPKNPKQGQT